MLLFFSKPIKATITNTVVEQEVQKLILPPEDAF
jgi:hypothetical protein